MLDHIEKVKLSKTYSICAEYLYPGTSNHIPLDSDNGYRMTQMIGLYGLVEPYSIARITTTQSGGSKGWEEKVHLEMLLHDV